MNFNLHRHINNGFGESANFQNFDRKNNEFQSSGLHYQNEASDKNRSAFNQISQANFYSKSPPPLPQQQYTCQKCTFFTNDSQAILAHLNSPFHLNVEIPRASAFQRPKQSFSSITLSDPRQISNERRPMNSSSRTNSMATLTHFHYDTTAPIVTSHFKQESNHESVNELDSVVCIGNDIIDYFKRNQTLQENNSFDNEQIKHVDVTNVNTINLSLEEEVSQSENEVRNKQPLQLNLQTQKQLQTEATNKKFKCTKCYFRSNWPSRVRQHFKIAHFQEAFDRTQCIQVLDENEATQTLAAYEKDHPGYNVLCKPYKCRNCSVISKNKSHQLHLQTEKQSQTEIKNKKFKCVQCHFRSNSRTYVFQHFKKAHPQLTFNRVHCIQVLDEEEAMRTLAFYEQNLAGTNFVGKPYKCRLCEHRASQKPNAYKHIRKVHQVEFHEAKKLVEVLPFDEAIKTVGEYNQKFGYKSGRYRCYLWRKLSPDFLNRLY